MAEPQARALRVPRPPWNCAVGSQPTREGGFPIPVRLPSGSHLPHSRRPSTAPGRPSSTAPTREGGSRVQRRGLGRERTRCVGQRQLLPQAAAAAQRGPCPASPAARVPVGAGLAGPLLFLRNHAHLRAWPAVPVGATGSWNKSAPRPITWAFRVPQTCPLTGSARSLSVPLGGQQPANTEKSMSNGESLRFPYLFLH